MLIQWFFLHGSHGNTPLHELAHKSSCSSILKIIDLFYNAGAHLDYANEQGRTALQLIPSSHNQIIDHFKKKLDVTCLKCRCARFIREQRLSYEHILPNSLRKFVQHH